MKNLFLFAVITLFIFTSCKKEESNNIPPTNLKWSYQLEPFGADTSAAIYDPIIFENIVIIPKNSFLGKKAELIALDKITGDHLWSWSEASEKYNKDGFVYKSYVHDGILAIGDNNYNAAIDIKTGETIWENLENNHGYSAISGVGDQIFKTGYIPRKRFWVQKANIYSGEWETIYEVDEIPNYNLGTYSPRAIEWEGKTYLAFHEIHWRSTPVYESNYFLNLYNITDDKFEWKTDTIPLDNPTSFTPSVFPAFDDGQILLGNEAIYSYNISDGRLKWKKSYDNSNTLGTDLAAINGKVYANNSDGFLLCLDVQTGTEIFRTTTGGSPSTIEFYEDNLYISAVTTYTHNQFMVIDANNGIVNQVLRSPFEEVDKTAVFQWALAVDQETGLAYTADYKNFLCYEFE